MTIIFVSKGLYVSQSTPHPQISFGISRWRCWTCPLLATQLWTAMTKFESSTERMKQCSQHTHTDGNWTWVITGLHHLEEQDYLGLWKMCLYHSTNVLGMAQIKGGTNLQYRDTQISWKGTLLLICFFILYIKTTCKYLKPGAYGTKKEKHGRIILLKLKNLHRQQMWHARNKGSN